MEKFTIANGTAFRYIEMGKGEKTLLLLHGYLESIESWEMLLPVLAKTYRVIAFDIPGHGIS
ncbi:MAG: alpha/beta fold hydrolase, partial [Rikenellaceae bacterium]